MQNDWIELFRAAMAEESPRPIVFALATVDEEGDPQVRSVVCRELDSLGAIWFTSDMRAAKVKQLAAHPNSAATFWMSSTRQQFRFAGRVELCKVEEKRRGLWLTLRPETRATFFWPEPGLVKSPHSQFPATNQSPTPPDGFAVLILRPAVVELLDLTTQPHRRRRWSSADSLNAVELNP